MEMELIYLKSKNILRIALPLGKLPVSFKKRFCSRLDEECATLEFDAQEIADYLDKNTEDASALSPLPEYVLDALSRQAKVQFLCPEL
jgi:hypothetical protein